MAALDPTQLQNLVNDVEAKATALADASTANDQAQSAAQAAIATAAGTLTAKNVAQVAENDAIDALVAYVNSLKTP